MTSKQGLAHQMFVCHFHPGVCGENALLLAEEDCKEGLDFVLVEIWAILDALRATTKRRHATITYAQVGRSGYRGLLVRYNAAKVQEHVPADA